MMGNLLYSFLWHYGINFDQSNYVIYAYPAEERNKSFKDNKSVFSVDY